MFLRGCSDHQDQLFCLFELKEPPRPYEASMEKSFSMGINCMSLAMWLGEDRKCSAAVVGLDLVLGLSMVYCSNVYQQIHPSSCLLKHFITKNSFNRLPKANALSTLIIHFKESLEKPNSE